MNIKDLRKDDRPRERIAQFGAKALSDTELLAILIGSGTKEHTVLDIASTILKKYRLSELKDLTYSNLLKIKGIKKAKACQLLACFELARRGAKKEKNHPSLETAEDIYNYIYHEIYLESNEIIIAILLDCKLRPIKTLVERGNSSHEIEIPVRRIIQEALDAKAYGIVLVHNHPSGEVDASIADIEATQELNDILMSLNILLLDHLVVSSSEYFSMNEHGLLSLGMEYNLIGDTLEKNTH
ncbi:MAG: DNA repair protein RadC [Anaeroplasmataceae bacterium]|nr:DNA repair protein RadC [Anaeroplasmataceae bacterium]